MDRIGVQSTKLLSHLTRTRHQNAERSRYLVTKLCYWNLQDQLNTHAICMWKGEGERERRLFFEGIVNGPFPSEGTEVSEDINFMSLWIPVLDHDHSDYNLPCFCRSRDKWKEKFYLPSLDANNNLICD